MDHSKSSKMKISISVIVVSVLCLSFYKLNLADWSYIKIPKQFISSFYVNSKNNFFDTKNAYKIQDGLPKNFVKDGSVDYTSAVQMALDKYRTVFEI